MPAAEDSFTATGPNAARPDALRNPHSAGIRRILSALAWRSHNERFSSMSEGYRARREMRYAGSLSKLSCSDRVAFDRWLKANAVVASIFSVALVVMAFAGCRPAGPVEGAAGATRPVCNADLPPMTQRCGTRCKEKLAKHASATSEAASETRQKHREREENAQFIEEIT